ncbi:MAG: hypothetical protein LPK45_03570, partial [Bacteroidota bacterium]|nr:hypothetical protein [Bacteroidota bacterium]MDX5430130.1 hypothetical protein [Bacteroidota bacterium]MDX5468891.1 hypothetical protein [Bacteroidota bacterium]
NKRWLSKWSQMRKRGFLRFWMIYGILYFVLSLGMILSIVHFFAVPLEKLSDLIGEDLLTQIGIAVACGLILSLLLWVNNELRYRRLSAKYPNAVRHF